MSCTIRSLCSLSSITLPAAATVHLPRWKLVCTTPGSSSTRTGRDRFTLTYTNSAHGAAGAPHQTAHNPCSSTWPPLIGCALRSAVAMGGRVSGSIARLLLLEDHKTFIEQRLDAFVFATLATPGAALEHV